MAHLSLGLHKALLENKLTHVREKPRPTADLGLAPAEGGPAASPIGFKKCSASALANG